MYVCVCVCVSVGVCVLSLLDTLSGCSSAVSIGGGTGGGGREAAAPPPPPTFRRGGALLPQNPSLMTSQVSQIYRYS